MKALLPLCGAFLVGLCTVASGADDDGLSEQIRQLKSEALDLNRGLPLLEQELGEAFGPGVRFVHGAHGIARRVAQLVEGQPMTRTVPDRAVTTGSLENFEKVRGPLSQIGLDRLEVL